MDVINVTADAETFTCNAYLAPEGSPTLVDAGAMDGVVDVVREHTDDLDRVVLTHQHGDHPRRTGELEDGDTVSMGDESFDVVYTPGHADDHVSFVSEHTLFSGDVVVYNDGAFDDGSFGRTDMAGQSRERLVESLETLLERLPDSVTAMYAGHGDAFHAADESVRDVIARALSRAERYEAKYQD